MRTILLIFLLCPSIFLFSQADIDQAIQGEWIQRGSTYDTILGDGYGEIFDARFIKMSFQNGNLLISYSPFELKNLAFKYGIDLDTLFYGSSEFKVVFPSKDRLRLQGVSDTTAMVLDRVKAHDLSIYAIESDTVYNSSFWGTPVFEGDLKKVLLAGGLIDFPANRKDRPITIEFILHSD